MTAARCAVVGLDSAFWPAAFWQAITDHPAAEVVAMCGLGLTADVIKRDFVADVDEWLAAHGQTRVDALDDVLDLGVDAAFVCTRNTRMPTVVRRLVAAGVPCFVAKPMGVTAADAELLASLDPVVLVTAGQLARTWEPWPTIARLVGEGCIGEVRTVRAQHQHGDRRAFPPELWYWDESEGDIATWLGWYAVDAVTALLGPIAAVQGVRRGDQLTGAFELADGRHATAEVHWTYGEWSLPVHEGEVVGTGGVIRYRGPGQSVQVVTAAGEELVPFTPGDGLAAEVAAFLAGTPVVTAAEAAHTLAVCATWSRAVTERRTLPIPVLATAPWWASPAGVGPEDRGVAGRPAPQPVALPKT